MGKRWSFDIMAELICNGDKRRYNELLRALVFVTPKVLSQRLKELESNGLIQRKVYPDETPVKVEYLLTQKGKELKKTISEIIEWGNKWSVETPHENNCELCKNWRKEHGMHYKGYR
ncbi:MAG: transcriptional regulator [Candidatus Altiarchaeales archaeon]|nr:transcriptional regulator [Candidatus Altiarchaeales archaeon]